MLQIVWEDDLYISLWVCVLRNKCVMMTTNRSSFNYTPPVEEKSLLYGTLWDFLA